MPLYKLSPYVYFFSWIFLAIFPYVYFTNYIYEPVLLYFTGASLYYAFVAVTNYKQNLPLYFKYLLLFVSVLLCYGCVLILIGDDIYWRTTGHFVRKYLYNLWLIPSLLSVFPVYVFTCRGQIGEREMKILYLIFFACSIYAFYGALKIQMANAALLKTGQEEYTVTSVYSFLSILPLIVLFKKRQLLQFVFLGVTFVYLVLSAKRGAAILGGIASLVLIAGMFVKSSFVKKIMIVLVTGMCMVGVYNFIDHQIKSSRYFAARVDQTLDGYTSKRAEYAQSVYEYHTEKTDAIQYVFGIGAQGTLSVIESFAHNDWLAILLEQGLFGAFLYLLYWIGFVITCLQSRVRDFDAFIGIFLLIIVGFGKTLFSMYYLPISSEMMTSSGFFTIALGFYLGRAFPQGDYEIQEDIRILSE